MKQEKSLNSEHLEAISKILADTEDGLTGSEIGHILANCGIPDTDASMTKWKRLYNAFVGYQNTKQYSNHVIAFIHKAMNPVRYVGAKDSYENKRQKLNIVLAFSGFNLSEDGKVHHTTPVNTIAQAEKKASMLKSKLLDRNVHSDVLLFCKAELVQENYFHAVLEASKSVASKVRAKSGLKSDGADLAMQAFSLGKTGKPLLAINSLKSETEQSEQKGFMNLLIGLFGTFRNPTAHAEKIFWPIQEQDALDILSLVSFIHRKLDLVNKF